MTLWPFRPRPSFGRRAEILGCWYLRKQGYLLLASPFHASRGEIDIVARDGEFLVFVEVKARRRDPHPEDAVSLRKQARIVTAAAEYRRQNLRLGACPYRFDILAVLAPARGRPSFRLYKDAFRARRDGQRYVRRR